jgi:competence protein ComGC
MKTMVLAIISVMMFVAVGQQKTDKTVTATFDGYEDGIYSFSDGEDQIYDFEKVDADVLKQFDLKSKKYLKKKFKITYKEEITKEKDGNDIVEYEMWTILKLELVE